MRLGSLGIACSLLLACHPVRGSSDLPQPNSFVHLKDQGIALLWAWGIPAGRPCDAGTYVEDGVVIAKSMADDECFRFRKPERFRGLWRNEFEGSRFCPAPAQQCDYDTPGDDIWLDTERALRKGPDGALYEVEFIGRQTAVKGHYGHMGGSDHDLIVDRLVSMKQIEPPSEMYRTN